MSLHTDPLALAYGAGTSKNAWPLRNLADRSAADEILGLTVRELGPVALRLRADGALTSSGELIWHILGCIRWAQASAPTVEIEDLRTFERLSEAGAAGDCPDLPWPAMAVRWPLGALVGDDARDYRVSFVFAFQNVNVSDRSFHVETGEIADKGGGRLGPASSFAVCATDGCSLWYWKPWGMSELLSRPMVETERDRQTIGITDLFFLETDYALRERARLACRGISQVLSSCKRRFHPSPWSAPPAVPHAPKPMRPILLGRREIGGAR